MIATCPRCTRHDVPVVAGRLVEHRTRADLSAPMCGGGGREAAK